MALVQADKIELSSPLGQREIQLLVGDITRLPAEDKVDFIFTSAFYGDYSAIAGSLIGSLKHNLGLDVKDLARNKAFDLREHFACWVSEALEQNMPYRRLVCFEYNRHVGTLSSQLSEIFRAMMPIFNNHDTTVITPLLATGNQGQSFATVMAGMINGACAWIHAGLPLTCLKIVLYSSNPARQSDQIKNCVSYFGQLKNKWAELENMRDAASDPYDVCFSFTPSEQSIADTVVQTLKQLSPDISIHSEPFVFDHEQVWQKEIFSVMKNSKRIIILLTPGYIKDTECLEQFNMALCCNRLKKEAVVMPVYMQTIQSIPSYFSLVQYIECRVRKSGETAEALLDTACNTILKSMKEVSAPAENGSDKSASEALQHCREVIYDIFVSYSHRDGDTARKLVDVLKEKHSDLNIFFDKSELKAGNLWQQALYEAVDRTRCLVAFLSPGYIQSSVCNEEWNIALARKYAHDSVLVIPVHTEALETIPRRMSSVPCVDMGKREESVQDLSEHLVHMVEKSRNSHNLPDVTIMKQKLSDLRAMQFKERFRLDGGQVVRKTMSASDVELKGEVVFSYAQDCLKLAVIMSDILIKHAPKLMCHLKAASQSERMKHLDSADLVVIFISDEYVASQPLVEELHTVLCRQRTVKDSTIVYFVQFEHDMETPFYFQALPFSVSMDDNLWRRLERASSNKNPRYYVDIDGMQGMYRCTSAQNLSLTAAAHDAIYTLTQRGTGTKLPYNIMNIYQVENEVEGIEDDQVHVHEHIITLSSINHLMCKEYSPKSSRPRKKSINPSPLLPRKEGNQENIAAQEEQKGESHTNEEDSSLAGGENSQHIQKAKEELRIQQMLLEEGLLEPSNNSKSSPVSKKNKTASGGTEGAVGAEKGKSAKETPAPEIHQNPETSQNLIQGDEQRGPSTSKTCNLL